MSHIISRTLLVILLALVHLLPKPPTRPVIAAAGKHVDVMSINYYEWNPLVELMIQNLSPDYLPVHDMLREHYRA